ncbi:MAG: flagellar biosynthesis protein FlhF, partial [Nitrospirae bacterium]
MHIRRFVAPTLLEAVRKVKEELGPDAVVLSTRPVRMARGRFGLLARSGVEVTAAMDRDRHPSVRERGAEEGRRAPR